MSHLIIHLLLDRVLRSPQQTGLTDLVYAVDAALFLPHDQDSTEILPNCSPHRLRLVYMPHGPRQNESSLDPRFSRHCSEAKLVRPDSSIRRVRILRYTGALQSLACSRVLTDSDYVSTRRFRRIWRVTGEVIAVLLVQVTLTSVMCQETFLCGLVSTPPPPVGIAALVGNDICVDNRVTEVNVVVHLQPVQQRHTETQTTISSRVSSDIVTDRTTQKRTKSKTRYDRRVGMKNFEPADKVLVLMTIPGQPLQARFHGPCIVDKQLGPGDFVIALTDPQKTKCVCRVNMLAKYHERDPRLGPWNRVGQSRCLIKCDIAPGHCMHR